MQCVIDKPAANDRDDLVDRIGELIAAILDVNGRLSVPYIPAIYV